MTKIEQVIVQSPKTPALFPPWKCFNCGECCKDMSISKSELKMILGKISPKIRELLKANTTIHIENDKFIWYKDKCMFFSEKKEKCLIYPIRPFSCRLFICGKYSPDESLVYVNNKCLNNTSRKVKDPYFRALAAENSEKSFKWGNRYGWSKRHFK